MTPRDALLLGRVSNLPTVWTNLLAGAVLTGALFDPTTAGLALLALTLYYVGGMYLNDAYDADIDAIERPERPIPGGRVGRRTVFTLGFGMLGLGLLALGAAGASSGTGWRPVVAGVVLAGCIVLYDAWHKANPISPLIMGACRMLVYVTAAYCISTELSPEVLVGALILLSYLIGLTYVAKQENIGKVKNLWPVLFLAAPVILGVTGLSTSPWVVAIVVGLVIWIGVALRFVKRAGPGDIPRAVISLIAGICIVDALLIALAGRAELALLAIAGFVLTLALQRFVPGT